MKTTIAKNNAIKASFLKHLGSIIYQLEKGHYHPHLDKERMMKVLRTISNLYDDLEGALGTGNENIESFVDNANVALKAFKESLNQELNSRVEEASSLLEFSITCVIDTLGGDNVIDIDEINKPTYTRNKLEKRLAELDSLISDFSRSNARLEKDISQMELSLEEVNEKIILEDNERRINDLYRQVTTINSKLDTLNVRRSSYGACSNLLDLIRVNAKEILTASEYSEVDLSKAKALLNINRLRVVLAEPEKALNVLKVMNKEIEALKEKTKSIDTKILSATGESTTINEDALKYKEALLAKKRAKETLENLDKISVTNEVRSQKVED